MLSSPDAAPPPLRRERGRERRRKLPRRLHWGTRMGVQESPRAELDRSLAQPSQLGMIARFPQA
jgi:hypothetical protein